jgi:hypothetical protein
VPVSVAWIQKARNSVRNPDSPRNAADARSAVTTCGPSDRLPARRAIGPVRVSAAGGTGCSPSAESTAAGSRSDRIAAPRQNTAVIRSASG